MKIFLVMVVITFFSFAATADETMIYNQGLQKILDIQDQIKDIHPLLNRVFPVVVAENDTFFIFDCVNPGKKYEFVKKVPVSMPIPPSIRAAFPLDSYEGKMGCVVTGDVFDSQLGYTTIFHEFIHCQQGETCELKLKGELEIAQKAMANQDYMWELNYPFPYEDKQFVQVYSAFLKAINKNDVHSVIGCRRQLKQILSKNNYEYMIWQEWKEGFARFIENQINHKLGLNENHYGVEKPYQRVTFYEGGSNYILFLSNQNPEISQDIEKLFYTMIE